MEHEKVIKTNQPYGHKKIIILSSAVVGTLIILILLVVKKGGGSGIADKSVWDWLDLVIIPAALAAGVWILNKKENQRNLEETERQKERDREAVKERDRISREIEQDRQQQETLSTYLDRMTDLLINHNLKASGQDSEVRMVARARTLSNLSYLSPDRKLFVIHFLLECGLITREFKLVDLNQLDLKLIHLFRAHLETVDFSYSNLQDANCIEVDFSEANFSCANLERAYFSKVNFTNVDFRAANLTGAFFVQANFKGANFDMATLEGAHIDGTTILPEGKKVEISGPLSRDLVQFNGNGGDGGAPS